MNAVDDFQENLKPFGDSLLKNIQYSLLSQAAMISSAEKKLNWTGILVGGWTLPLVKLLSLKYAIGPKFDSFSKNIQSSLQIYQFEVYNIILISH